MYRPDRDLAGSDGQDYQRLLTLAEQRRYDELLIWGELLLERLESQPLVRASTHDLLCWLFIDGLRQPSPKALLHGEEAVRLAEQLGEQPLLLQANLHLASARFQLAQYGEAEAGYLQLLSRLNERPALLHHGRARALQGLAQIDLALNRPTLALERIGKAEAQAAGVEGQSHLAESYRYLALALLRLGRPKEAEQALAQVDRLDLQGTPPGRWWRSDLLLTRAKVEAALCRWRRSRQLVMGAIALAQELHDLPGLAEATGLLAVIEAVDGSGDVRRRARAALNYAIQSGRRDLVAELHDRLGAYLHTGI